MLEQIESAKDDIFVHVELFSVFLNGILTGIYIKPVDVLIKQVSFGRSDFTGYSIHHRTHSNR